MRFLACYSCPSFSETSRIAVGSGKPSLEALGALVVSLLLAANLGAPAWVQDVSAPTQGAEPSDVEALKERV